LCPGAQAFLPLNTGMPVYQSFKPIEAPGSMWENQSATNQNVDTIVLLSDD